MWWKALFKSVRKWSPQMVAKKRRVWLNVYGIPLHVWDEGLFELLGASFGDFLDFDENTIGRRRLDMARIFVTTSRRGFIDQEFQIKVMGVVFKLWVVEEKYGGGGWRTAVLGEEDEVQSVGSREGELIGGGEKVFSDEGDRSPRSYNSVHLGVGPFPEKVGPSVGCFEKQRESLNVTFLPCQENRKDMEDLFSKNMMRTGQVSVQTAFVGDCSADVSAREVDLLADQQLVGQEVTSAAPIYPTLLDFPPLRKAVHYGPGPVLNLREAKSLKVEKLEVRPKGPVYSDSAVKGAHLVNKHIRFLEDSECLDASDSIEDYGDAEERALKFKKKLHLKKQGNGANGRKGGLGGATITPPSGIDIVAGDQDCVVTETQFTNGGEANLKVLAEAKLDDIKKQVGFSYSPLVVNKVTKEPSKVN